MSLDVQELTEGFTLNDHWTYTRRDARLYALSVGFGTDPLDEAELSFVCATRSFKTVPTMATSFSDVILALTNACNLKRPELALHGEQRLELFAPLPESARLDIKGYIPAIYDRGERGAEIHMVAEGHVEGISEPLYRATYVTIARGDGGFGGEPPDFSRARNRIPDRSPDKVWDYSLAPNQALIYSLNGDPNPIHTQPSDARQAGFDAPIMHGLGTYGMACRAVLMSYLDADPSRMRCFDVRFSAPVFPGETLLVDMWQLDDGISFQGRVQERDAIVLKNGYCRAA